MSFTSSLRQSFLAGLLAILPLFITYKVLAFAFVTLDGVLGGPLNAVLRQVTGREDLHVYGVGLISTLLLVVLIGYLTRKVFFREALRLVERGIQSIPVVRSLYTASRQIVVPFADDSKLPFSQVVLVEYPMAGRYTLGLVAKERVTHERDDDRMVVFFPSNHLHLGYPVILHRSEVQVVDMTVEEAVKFFVSCGVLGDDAIIRQGGEILPDPHVQRMARVS